MAAGKRAVVIGINQYSDPKIPPLTGAVNDARELRERLETLGNFEIAPHHFLLDQEAKCSSILKAVSDLLWRADQYDLALFYFSGHGFLDGYKNGYIAPYDMLREEPLVYGISLLELKRLVLNSLHPNVVMILDSCHSGIATGEKGMPAIPENPYDPFFENLSQEEGGEGKFIIASSEGDQVSREIPACKHGEEDKPHPHGTFTYHLLEGLGGKAQVDDTGRITLNSLLDHVEREITKLGRQKPRFFAADASRLNSVEIARSPEIFREYLDRLMKEAQEQSENENPIYLILSAKNVLQILSSDKNNKQALDLRITIGHRLKTIQESADRWLSRNIGELTKEIPKGYKRIEDLADYLNFDKIGSLDHDSETLLGHLSRVSMNLMDTAKFIRYCKTYENQPESGMASSIIKK